MRLSNSVSLLLFVLFSLVQCGRKAPQVEKTMENGVEVVINHLEPYSLPGIPSTLRLEEVLSIDTENDDIAKTGLTSMESFCLDGDGNIYIMMSDSPENFIYKFDASGKFLTSFGRKGQGPGEFDSGGDILVDEENLVIAKDETKDKFFIFSKDGVLIEEVKIGAYRSLKRYLGKKKYLTFWMKEDPGKPVLRFHYYISDDRVRENQEFYLYERDDDRRAPRLRPRANTLVLNSSDKNIFIGDSRQGYEISVFDFSGNLVRKIRKAFQPVTFPEDYKGLLKKFLAHYSGEEFIKKLDFPEHLPPFFSLFADDQGRLYVMTNEKGGGRNYWYDVFSSEGAFIGRFQLDNVQVKYFEGQRYYELALLVEVNGDRLYCLREKDSGFIVLTVYRMIWS